jgi:hypothetical protein
MILFNLDYTKPPNERGIHAPALQLPKITFTPEIESFGFQVIINNICDKFYVEAKKDKEGKIASPPESHALYDLLVLQSDKPGVKPAGIRVIFLDEYAEHMRNYPAVHPYVVNAMQKLHPIPRAIIGAPQMKKTVDIDVNYKDASARENADAGFIHLGVHDVVYFTETYLAEMMIPCQLETFHAIYGDTRSSYPYNQSDLAAVTGAITKTGYTRDPLKIPFVPKEGEQLPAVIAFDLGTCEYPDSGYRYGVLELFPLDLSREQRRQMTPEEGHALIMSHRRPDEVMKTEAADVGNIKKYVRLLPFLQPKSDAENANKRIPLFACFALREDIKPLGEYNVDASSLHLPGMALPTDPNAPANPAAFTLQWLQKKFPSTVVKSQHPRPSLDADTPEPDAKRAHKEVKEEGNGVTETSPDEVNSPPQENPAASAPDYMDTI